MSRLKQTEAQRVLGIIRQEPAHELYDRPLQAPLPFIAKGWLAYGPEYDPWVGSRRVRARTIHITDAGRAALADPSGGEKP